MLLNSWACNSLIFATVISGLNPDQNLMSEASLPGLVGFIYCYCLNYRLHSRLFTGIRSWEFHYRDSSGSLHPRIFLPIKEYTNMSVYNTTIYFIYFKIIYRQGDMFRPSLGHPQALKGNGSKTT